MFQFLKEEVTLLFPEVLQTIRDELRFYNGLLVPVTGQLPDGIEFIKQYRRDFTGMSARYMGIATDIPTVDILMSSHQWTVARWIIGATWSDEELIAYQRRQAAGEIASGGSPIQQKMDVAARVIGENLNRAIAFGEKNPDGSYNFKGFLNHPEVTDRANLTTSPYTMTGPNLYQYLQELVWQVSRQSLLTPGQFTLLIPPALFQKLALPFASDSPNISPFGMLTDPSKGIYYADIEMLPELSFDMLEAAGVLAPGTNKDRLIIYQRAPETVSRLTAPLRTTEPLRVQQLHWNVAMHQRSSEIMVRQPLRIAYRDFAKPA